MFLFRCFFGLTEEDQFGQRSGFTARTPKNVSQTRYRHAELLVCLGSAQSLPWQLVFWRAAL